MERTGTAKAGKDEVTWIATTSDEDLLHRLGHVLATDANHALSCLQRGKADFLRKLGHGLVSRFDVEVELAAEGRFETAQQQVCVGDCRLHATSAVAHWSRFRSRAFGADAKRTTLVHPAD
ncbi:hypothetical protein D9M70_518200 [compost metagenome]